jgi:hypothetical protein
MPKVGRKTKQRSARGSGQRMRQQESPSNCQFVYWTTTGSGEAVTYSTVPTQYNYPPSHGIPGRRSHALQGAGQIWRLGR